MPFLLVSVWEWRGQGATKRCRLSLLTNSALGYEPKCGGRRGSCGVVANEYSCVHRSPNKLWRSIFNLWESCSPCSSCPQQYRREWFLSLKWRGGLPFYILFILWCRPPPPLQQSHRELNEAWIVSSNCPGFWITLARPNAANQKRGQTIRWPEGLVISRFPGWGGGGHQLFVTVTVNVEGNRRGLGDIRKFFWLNLDHLRFSAKSKTGILRFFLYPKSMLANNLTQNLILQKGVLELQLIKKAAE